MFSGDAKFLDQIGKRAETPIVYHVLQVADAFVFPGAEVKCFFVTSDVGIIPNWGES